MKEITDSRIKNGKEVSSDKLVETIKTANPILFDQMLIESEERKTYYYVKYKAQAYTREPKTLRFPLFKDLVGDFEKTIERSGEAKILEDDRLIQKVIQKGYSPSSTQRYSGENLTFSELKLVIENDKIKEKQPFYYLPSETDRHTCETCNGDKYTTCTEYECHGQHIYDCSQCGATGKIDCDNCGRTGHLRCKKCSGRGEYSCTSCDGKGEKKCKGCWGKGVDSMGKRCTRCSGRGYEKCGNCRDGIIRCEKCSGKGEVRCDKCAGHGEITCSKCDGRRQITCGVCYGDHTDGRYGKVDCETCETAGELASISYIETEIKSDNLDLFFTDKTKIDAPGFGLETIKKFANANGQMVKTYNCLNGDNKENYDEYSTVCSKNALKEVGDHKDRYPKLISEEMYYEGVPCATFNYNHILSASFHDVSIISTDKERVVLFHSNPSDISEEKESFKDRASEWLRQAFSTKTFKNKIDRKHEMFLMIHMAKADGIIEEQEKRYLSKAITGLHGFTKKEKIELFGLMSACTLPPILPTNAYFSSRERAEEAKKKIIELVAKADGEYEPQEKAKIEEINKAIELGYKAKPSAMGRFFKTWQVSVSLFLLLCIIVFGTWYSIAIFPQHLENIKAQREIERLKIEAENDAFLNKAEQFLTGEEEANEEKFLNNEEQETNYQTQDEEFSSKKESFSATSVLYKIINPDGYSDMYDEPNGVIIDKVYEVERFEIIDSLGWYKKVKLSNGTEGFIDESSIVEAED